MIMKIKKLMTPKQYWEDEKWLNKNGTKLSKKYPNMWIAVVNKKVVSYGKNLSTRVAIYQCRFYHHHRE